VRDRKVYYKTTTTGVLSAVTNTRNIFNNFIREYHTCKIKNRREINNTLKIVDFKITEPIENYRPKFRVIDIAFNCRSICAVGQRNCELAQGEID